MTLRPRNPSPVPPGTTFVTSLIRGDKALDNPPRATDEEAVDIGQCSECASVARVDAAAIEDRNLSTGFSEQIFAPGPDQFGYRFNVVGAGWSASGTNRRHRLIGDLNLSQVL